MTGDNSWQPSASLQALSERAALLAYLRRFFADRGVLEVETPVLGASGVSDPHIDSVPASLSSPGIGDRRRSWLQTSPEYHMKRLLAAGSGPIYQVSRVFRDGERGSRHNPEFTLLEWYRPGMNDSDLMTEVGKFVSGWLGCPEPTRMSYREALKLGAGVDPFEDEDALIRAEASAALNDPSLAFSLTRDDWLDILMTHCVEPMLVERGAVFIHDYPPSQAALARVSNDGEHTVAHRFELYVKGVELCNGYWELTDAREQRRRFESDNVKRRALGKEEMPVDERLLAALDAGMPSSAGVALGLDRLLMLGVGVSQIEEVMAFPVTRA